MSAMGDLMVRVHGDVSDLKSSLNQANKGINSFAKNAEESVQRISAGFKTLKTAVGGAVIAGAVMKVAQMMKEAAVAAIEYGDEVQKAMSKTGLAAEEFTSLAYAAKQNDISLEQLGSAFKKLQIATSEAATGNKTVLETFDALGINIEEFKGLNADQQFELIADQIMKMGSEADRTRALVALFGKAGADLLPMMSDGAEGIKKLREEAGRVGAVMSQEQIERLADADTAIKNLETAWQSFSRTLTASVAPAISTVLNMLTKSDAQRVNLLKQQLDGFNEAIEEWEKKNPGAEMNAYIKQQYASRREVQAELAKLGEYKPTSGPTSRVYKAPETVPGYKPEEEKDKTSKTKVNEKDLELEARMAEIRAEMAEKTQLLNQVEGIRRDQMTEQEKLQEKAAQDMWTLMEAYDQGVITLQQYNDLLAGIVSKQAEVALAEIEPPKIPEESFAEYKRMQDMMDGLKSTQDEFIDGFSDELAEALSGGEANFNDFAKSIVKQIMKMIIQMMIFRALSSLAGSSNPALASFGKAMGGGTTPVAGTRASGGPVSGGKPYLVGEKGPEIVVPTASGHVIPNNAMGASPNFKVEVTNKTSTPAKATQSNARFDGKQWIVSVILEDMARGGPISNGLGQNFGLRRAVK